MGRHRWTSRFTVEECLPLDVEKFHQAGPALADASPASGTMSWTRDGDVVGTIRYEIIPNAGRVSVCIPCQSIMQDGENRPVEQCLISVTTVRPHLGGRRFLFVCRCGRRVRLLYLPPGEQMFGCRHCHDLTYRSAQQHDQREYDLARDPEALSALLHAALSGTNAKRVRLAFLGIGGLALLGKWSCRGTMRQLAKVRV
jgi:hypothetical protein